MITWLTRCFVCLWLQLPFVPVALAVDPDVEIARLVKQLGSEDFRMREAASKRLAEIGEGALDALVKVETGGDPEVRFRAREIVAVLEKKLCVEQLRLTGHAGEVWQVAGCSPSGRRSCWSGIGGASRYLKPAH